MLSYFFVRLNTNHRLLRSSCSREKIKLTGELNRACRAVGRCKAVIQETVRLCEHTPGLTPIPEDRYDDEECCVIHASVCECLCACDA